MGSPAPRSLFSPLKSLVLGVAAAVVASTLIAPLPAVADTSPATGTPATVSTDALPTVQIDGIVWSQVVVGNTVYAGGNFLTAQPAGSAAGVNTVRRTHLLAYNLETGALITSFAPELNGQVRALAASPDGARVYAVGEFTTVSGQTRNRIAAFDTDTGALSTSFAPSANAGVSSVAATNSTVYFGGNFSAVGSAQRPGGAAAVRAADGAIQAWAPAAAGGRVTSMVISPDATKLVLGGSFTTMNGSGDPGYGLAAVTADTGASLPLPVNKLVRNAGVDSSITSLSSDGKSFFGTGYVFGVGGNLEGMFRASWDTGELVWLEDCHGDTYSSYTAGDVSYIAGHPHYCANLDGGFPQSANKPWDYYRGLAFTNYATGTLKKESVKFNWEGTPSPTLLHFYPDFNIGTASGANQGPWSVTGTGDYVVYGGEFTTVNGKRQQGLVRFATAAKAPNADGPRVGGANWVPTVVSNAAGTAHVSWPANYDRDNESLSYRLIRDGVNASPVFETTESSAPWRRPSMGYEDKGLEPGSTHNYRVRVSDPRGNVAWSSVVSVTIAGADTVSPYAEDVLASSPTSYWRLGEGSGSVVADWAGHDTAALTTGATRGAAGAITGDTDAATTFSAASKTFAVGQSYGPGPDTFAIEAWFKTTSTSGGKIVGFGNAKVGSSTIADRHIYLDGSGRVFFGVRPTSQRTVNSGPGFNDGKWHQVAANLGPNGMELFVDGVRVGQRTDATAGQAYDGYWRIGGDLSWGGTAQYLSGSIDDVAIYPKPLTGAEVNRHYSLSGRTPTVPSAPADDYGKRVYSESPYLYWRLDDAAATTAADASLSRDNGTYSGGVTTQQAGVPGAGNRSVAFNGSNGLLVSPRQVANPQVYSLELWFNTTTTAGGKLIGFGDAASGLSTQYDRHVYLQPNGQVVFGTRTSQENRITSAGAYNDGRWHHVVATQSSAGLRLYLDGNLAGTHSSTAGGIYNGYWRVGGDRTWSTGTYVSSRIDEVAVYGVALDAGTIGAHFALGSGGQSNQPPVASFTASADQLDVSVDGSGSADADGAVASHAWDFGDGGTAGGVRASHSYARAGTYTVTLTVTDDRGATATTTRQVTVAASSTSSALVTDSFSRTVTNGLGSAEVGGAWSLSSSGSAYRVDSGVGSFSTTAGATRSAYQSAVASSDTDMVATVAVPQAITGAGAYVSLVARRTAAGEYLSRVKILGDGSVAVQVMRDGVSLRYVNVPSVTHAPGDRLRVRVQATGASPTTVRTKVWAAGTAEPADWQATATDSTAGYQTAGSVGLRSYLSSSATNSVTVQFDDLAVTSVSGQ